MKIGLYFGSFNPIHNGHLALANYIVEYSDLDRIWFVISPQNPFKEKKTLLKDYHRLQLVESAIEDYDKFRTSNVEFKMPKPSYTSHTLIYLCEKYPEHEFSLIVGEDNLPHFHKWKNFEYILENHRLYVYPRPGVPDCEMKRHPQVCLIDAPQMDISSSFIRQAIKEGKEIPFFMPSKAYDFMRKMHFYE